MGVERLKAICLFFVRLQPELPLFRPAPVARFENRVVLIGSGQPVFPRSPWKVEPANGNLFVPPNIRRVAWHIASTSLSLFLFLSLLSPPSLCHPDSPLLPLSSPSLLSSLSRRVHHLVTLQVAGSARRSFVSIPVHLHPSSSRALSAVCPDVYRVPCISAYTCIKFRSCVYLNCVERVAARG